MAISDMLVALSKDWDRVDGLLDNESRTALHGLVVELGEVDRGQDREVLAIGRRIALLLFEKLSTQDPVVLLGHRLVADPVRPTAGDRELAATILLLRERVPQYAPLSATQRILGAAWENANALRRRSVDPDLPDLIRLDRDDGGCMVPSFQFDDAGAPIPIVLRVNQVLDARTDPWAAADWWLSPNLWLHAKPAALIGATDPDLLVAAAVAAVEG